ncbi:hypothetical protein P8452_32452 [Trifolium repens]|nr:hypothetical protein P8452_32452 [Trifolium repens]
MDFAILMSLNSMYLAKAFVLKEDIYYLGEALSPALFKILLSTGIQLPVKPFFRHISYRNPTYGRDFC